MYVLVVGFRVEIETCIGRKSDVLYLERIEILVFVDFDVERYYVSN